MVNIQAFSICFGRSPLIYPHIIIQPGISLPCLPVGNNTMIHHLSTLPLFSFQVINYDIQACINGRYLYTILYLYHCYLPTVVL